MSPSLPAIRTTRRTPRAGFTLIEVLIVVVILGILATIVIPIWGEATEDSRRQAFISTLKEFADLAEVVRARTGRWPADASTGNFPPEFAGYIEPRQWENGTPIGGEWDVEFAENGITSAVGVHFNGGPSKDDAYMTRIDASLDDGNLETGAFRRLGGDRYYYILAN